MTTAGTLRAGLYTRVSKDASGTVRSPREQEADARRDCERQGWDVVTVYEDVRGASRHSRGARPDYDRLRADVAAGMVDVLVAWEASRFQRDLQAYSELADLCRRHGVRWSYNGRLYDLDDPEDEFQTGLDALLASREAGVTRKRVKRALAANAAAGRVHGKIQYGYRRLYDPHSGALLGQEPDPVTGPIVTELFRRVAAGESLRSLATEMDVRGLPTARGGRWNGALIGHLLQRESYLGRRTHHGQVTAEGAWPALTDEPTFYAVQAGRAGKTREVVGDGRARHLLSGIVRCGVCDDRVIHDSRNARPGQNPLYRCYQGKCVSRTAALADDAVAALVIARLSRPDDALTTSPAADNEVLQAALHEATILRARLVSLEDDVAEGRLSGPAFGRIEAAVSTRLADAERRARTATVAALPAEVRALTEGDVEASWESLTVEERRPLVRALLIDAKFERKRGNPSVPTDALGLSFCWYGSDERQII